MIIKNTLIGLTLLIAIGLTWVTYISYQPQNQVVTDTSSRPDAFMEEVVSLILDKQGMPNLKIVTPKMVHFNDNDTTLLVSPHLTLYRKSPQPWFITSKSAKATQGIDNVYFSQNVTIQHAADKNNPATLIKTSSLLVHPNEQTAETKDLITFIQPSIIVKSTGMFANMNTGDIKLLSQTRGEYVPDAG